MQTNSIKQKEIEKKWYVIDAENQVLGRFASQVAQILRGKNKPYFTPHMDMGDFVIIINAEKISVTGNKELNKKYFFHTGYPGHHRQVSVEKMREKSPEFIITNAVKGMLPHNKLGRKIIKNLKVFCGPEHTHKAQQPKTIKL